MELIKPTIKKVDGGLWRCRGLGKYCQGKTEESAFMGWLMLMRQLHDDRVVFESGKFVGVKA